MKGKFCLGNLIFFCYKVTCLVDEGKAADLIFLDLSKALDIIPHSILLDTLSKWELNSFTMHWVMDWLHGRAQMGYLWLADSH